MASENNKNSSEIISYKFRIYPNKKQREQMGKHLTLAKNLWNELLAHCKQIYKDFGYFPTKNTLQLMVKDYGLFSQTQQEIAHRIYNSMIRIFRLRERGIKVGFPRFKSLERMKSIYYPQNRVGFKLGEKKLRITPFGEINIKKHRDMEGEIKTLNLKRESSGKWFAIFSVVKEKTEPKQNNGEPVGLDLGLITFATLSNGTIIKNPRHLKRYEQRLNFFQRKLSRKKKSGKNREKEKLKVARIHEKIKNIRTDFLHKLSTSLVYSYSLIALEKLNPKEMVQEKFGKSINDASWNSFTNMLSYKAEEAGCRVIFVNPENTTKKCNKCNSIVDKQLTDRIHNCPNCGLSIDRDLNASINILNRATLGQRGSNACGNVAVATFKKQEAPSREATKKLQAFCL